MAIDPKKHEMPTQDPAVRAHNFDEVALGYTAEVDGDDRIVLDREELETAFFISREELEMNPVRPALTQEMIEAFRLGKIR